MEDTVTRDLDFRTPQYRGAPDRWLVVRRLHPGTYQPDNVVQKGFMSEVMAWVVESNRIRQMEEFGRDVDIELECAPFIIGGSNTDSLRNKTDTNSNTIENQAEVFIGRTVALNDWNETASLDPTKYVPLDVLDAANPLFADYVPHNANVFSMSDNFRYKSQKEGPDQYLSKATASYYIVGWHADEKLDPIFNINPAVLVSFFQASVSNSTSMASILNSLPISLQRRCSMAWR